MEDPTEPDAELRCAVGILPTAARGPEPVRAVQRGYRQARLRRAAGVRSAAHDCLVSIEENELRAAPRVDLVAPEVQESDGVPHRRRLLLRSRPDGGPGAADRFRPGQPDP